MIQLLDISILKNVEILKQTIGAQQAALVKTMKKNLIANSQSVLEGTDLLVCQTEINIAQ